MSVDYGAILGGAGSLVTGAAAAGALVVGVLNRKAASDARERARDAAESARAAKLAAEDSKREIIATKDGVFELGKQVDGRFSELLQITRDAALAEGRLEGTASEKKRVADESEQESHNHRRRESGT